MLKKLKSVFENPRGLQLLSALESIVFSTLLFLASSDSRLILLFLAAAFYFYFKKAFNVRHFLSSFFVLIAISLLLTTRISTGGTLELVLFSLISGILFFLLLGIKNLIFFHRQPFYYLLNGFLMFAVLALFFSASVLPLFIFRYLAVGLAIFLLFREFLVFNFDDSFNLPNSSALARRNFISFVFAFLTIELSWGIALLPLGWLNSASLGLLFVLILEDFTIHNWSGTMTRQVILRNLTILVFLGLVIAGTSRWTL